MYNHAQNIKYNKNFIKNKNFYIDEDVYNVVIKQNGTARTNQGFLFKKSRFRTEQINKIRKDLTMIPDIKKVFNTSSKSFHIYEEVDDLFIVPWHYGRKNILDIPDLIKLHKIPTIDFIWNNDFKLRPNQVEAVNTTLKVIKDTGGALMQIKCGGGKTVDALYMICQLKVKTLVVLPTIALTSQWAKEIKQFIPDATIGFIKTNCFNINCDIVLAVINSLAMKDFEHNTFKDFGFVIFDECHNYGAKTFAQAFPKVQCQYALGLSATPYRNDGLENVFLWYIGDIAYQDLSKNNMKPIIVNIVTYNMKSQFSLEVRNSSGDPDFTSMVNNICDNKERTNLGIKYIKELATDPKRFILVLSHRREHLEFIKSELDIYNVDCGLYMGQMKEHELEETLKKQVILGIYNLCNEAFNVPKLNTLIMMTPVKNNKRTMKFDQTMGRIMRKEHDINPVIVDIYDKFSVFIGLYVTRRKYYSNDNNYVINEIDISQDKDLLNSNLITEIINDNNDNNNIKKKKIKELTDEEIYNILLEN